MPLQQRNSITKAFIQAARNEKHALDGLIKLSAPIEQRRSAWRMKFLPPPQQEPFYRRVAEEIRKEHTQETSFNGAGSSLEECRGLWLSHRSCTTTKHNSRKRTAVVVYKKSRDLSLSPDVCESDSDTESQSRSLKRQKRRNKNVDAYLSEEDSHTSESRCPNLRA